jgi:hypothetical protein
MKIPFVSAILSSSNKSVVKATGGTVTTYGSYTLHTFTTTGNSTFTALTDLTVDVLVVGGGGSGGTVSNRGSKGGGGGGGQVIYSLNKPITSSTYNVSVGRGGTDIDTALQSSVFDIISNPGNDPLFNFSKGGMSGSGNNGGNGNENGYISGGGGGDSENGYSFSGSDPGNGGAGTMCDITGAQVYYGGGGGGTSQFVGGNGGNGGGGRGTYLSGDNWIKGNAIPNTGGGGGGGNGGSTLGPTRDPGNGGSGIVIIRYLK